MKTQYFRRPKRFFTPLQGILAGVAGIVILLVILIRVFAPGFFTTLATPFWSLGDFISGSLVLHDDAKKLAEEVATLRTENEALAQENHTLAGRLKDDAELPDAHGIMAGVLARPPMSPYDALIIGKGNADGVYDGMRVFAGGVPVGVVESASVKSARVLLYSAPGKETEGWAGEHRAPITLKGQGAGAFIADMPKDASIQEGDTVYLPGPGAIPAGTVLKIESHPSSPRSTLFIRPLANPFTITAVRVVSAPAP